MTIISKRTERRNTALRLAATLTIVAIAVVGISSCSLINSLFGSKQKPVTEAQLDIPRVPEQAINSVYNSGKSNSFDASNFIQSGDGGFAMSSVNGWFGESVGSWSPDSPQKYDLNTSGPGTTSVSWQRSGDTWTWVITGTSSTTVNTYTVTVTKTSSGWKSKVVQQKSSVNHYGTVVDGSTSSDGSSGTYTYDQDPGTSSTSHQVISWKPSTVSGFKTHFDIVDYSNGTKTKEMVFDINGDGSSVQYTYTTY